MAFMTSSFNSFAKAGYNTVSSSMDAQASAPPAKTTLMAKLAPALKTSVPAIKPVAIDASKPGAGAVAHEVKKGVVANQQDIGRTKAAAGDMIKQAQAEISEACQVNEVSAGDVFPAASMSAGCEAELVGAGTLGQYASGAIDAVNVGAKALDFANGMQGAAPEAVSVAIADTLRASCSAPEHGFGLIQNADAAPRLDNVSAFPWEDVLEQHPDALAEIMYFDPDNPSAMFPEFAEMNNALALLAGQIDLTQGIMNANEWPPVVAAGVEMTELPPAQFFQIADYGDMEVVASMSMDIAGVAAPAVDPAKDLENALKSIAPAAPGMMSA